MKSRSLSVAALALVALASSAPAFADGGGIMGAVGAPVAFLIDVPEGVVVDSAVKCPYKFSTGLAGAFGDENGWKQIIVGTVIGVPSGFLFGIPYGAVAGGRHGLTVGWDKPFSAESFIVSNESK
jgi:hypothetical protein